MDKSLLSKRLRKAAIIVTFLPLVGFVIYQALRPAPIFGIVWCFFAVIFAVIALRYHKTGSILMIFAGALFFLSTLLTNHYIEFYLPVSGVYTVGGILHFINAFFLER